MTTQSNPIIPQAKGIYGRFILDVDIGGTFTDCVISRGRQCRYLKVETTPHDLAQCLQEALSRAAEEVGVPDLKDFLSQTRIIRLSTSLATNTLLEHKGPSYGLLLSPDDSEEKGDKLDTIGGLIPVIIEAVGGKINCSPTNRQGPGEVNPYFREDQIREKVHRLLENGARMIIVSLRGGSDWGILEKKVKDLIDRYYSGHFLGAVPVLLSHQVSSHEDYQVRTYTALVNACCLSSLSEPFFQMEIFLRSRGYKQPLQIVHSSGGSRRVAKTKAFQTINSGAAAGIFGIRRVGISKDLPDLITVDIGGTSTEIGLVVDGSIEYAAPSMINGLSLDLNQPILSTLSLGGGTLVRLEDDQEISLGPESAGAFPGPVCYGLGGSTPTLTDAYLVLGYLQEDYFLGGGKRIFRDLAEKAFQVHLASPLGITVAEAAFQTKKKVMEIIDGELIKILTARGLSPSRFSLVAIGGGGGVLAADLAARIGARAALVFRAGGVFGAFGSSGMDLIHSYDHKMNGTSANTTGGMKKLCRSINQRVKELQRQACIDMRGEGFQPVEIGFELELIFKADPGNKTIRIKAVTPFLRPDRDGDKISKRLWKKSWQPISSVRLSEIRLLARASIPHSHPLPIESGPTEPTPFSARNLYVGDGHWNRAAIYRWDSLPVLTRIAGPALIESPDTTVLVPLGWAIRFDRERSGSIEPSTG